MSLEEQENIKNITTSFFKIALGVAAFFASYNFYQINSRMAELGVELNRGQDKIEGKIVDVAKDIRRLELKIVILETKQTDKDNNK